ncbi:MAG TPA: DUF3750 domain-containing protein [Xanthobacteraceae bacterium]
MLTILAIFLFPLALHGALYSMQTRAESYATADWSSIGMLRPASTEREARLLIFTGRTGHWRGIFAVHSWVVFKAEGAPSWNRYDVVGWGEPVRNNYWAPDSRWWGTAPRVLLDIRGAQAAALIPRVEAAITSYQYGHAGDYRIWPGPNSNTFTASLLRAMPELETTLPSNAIGKDFRAGPYLGLTDSRTGIEASLFGIVGVKLGWVEGVEVNFLGLVAGLDLRHPAIKLPGFGRIGVDDGTALAAPAG